MELKRVLALAPHTDDIELGCGGFLSKLKKQYPDLEVDAVSFSSAQPLSVGDPVEEFKSAMSILDIKGEFLNFTPRVFHEQRQDILDFLWNRNKDNEYDLVLCPSSYDNHQDHQVLYEECFRAFKKTSILGYEMPWNNRTFSTDVFVKLEKENLDDKFKMLDCYKTQGERVFMSKDYIYDVARTRGLQVGSEYAECYEAIRVVI
jgi:LmbE family N-acetylglucosaminyl deacetylase